MRVLLWIRRPGAPRSPRPSPDGGKTLPLVDCWLLHGVREYSREARSNFSRRNPGQVRFWFAREVEGLPLFPATSCMITGCSWEAPFEFAGEHVYRFEFLAVRAVSIAGLRVWSDGIASDGPIEYRNGSPVWVQYLGPTASGVLPGVAGEEVSARRVARES